MDSTHAPLHLARIYYSFWSGYSESNRDRDLGRVLCYHYTIPAWSETVRNARTPSGWTPVVLLLTPRSHFIRNNPIHLNKIVTNETGPNPVSIAQYCNTWLSYPSTKPLSYNCTMYYTEYPNSLRFRSGYFTSAYMSRFTALLS